METVKFEPGMIYNDNILIIYQSGQMVEFFDLKEAQRFYERADLLHCVLQGHKPVSCKDVFFQKLQMSEMD